MDTFTVYAHIAPNGKKYIGITSQPVKRRWQNGLSAYTGNKHFINAIKKYGWDNFKHSILYDDLTEKEAKSKEVKLIAFYKTQNPKFGYNITAGGEGANGYKPSKAVREHLRTVNTGKKLSLEQRRKISESQIGKKMSKEFCIKLSRRMKGKTVSDETRRLISERVKAAMKSPDVREKIRKAKRGKKASSETRKKMTIAQTGKPKKIRTLICENIKTHERHTFKSLLEATEWMNTHGYPNCKNSYIDGVLSGTQKSTCGFKWYEQKER